MLNALNPSCACTYIPHAPETFWVKWQQNYDGLENYPVSLKGNNFVSFHLKVDWFFNSPVSHHLCALALTVVDAIAPFFALSHCVILESESPTDERFQTNLVTFKVCIIVVDTLD